METFLSSNFDEISVYRTLLETRYRKERWGGGGGGGLGVWELDMIFHNTYLLAQIRAASRASDESCSYSFETMCTQRGNSSTLARFRPRSKMRILGSGTPRLKRDFG